tara:strand:+ start:86 stop:625 length:540 start_codon:yes stop_codon:yes gene_type:complete
MNKYIIIIAIFILNSCCKEGIGTHYPLSNDEKNMVTYSINDSLILTHSNGTDFKFLVTNKESGTGGSDVKHCGDSYYTYDTEITSFTSNTSELLINLEIAPEEIYPYLTITVNRINFNLNVYESPNLDSLVINGVIYYDIYGSSYNLDSTVIQPKGIWYNNDKGILQLTMTNNEKYSIK